MCGAMVSLTPCIASKVERERDRHECAEFYGVDDMITKLNGLPWLLLKAFHSSLPQGRIAISWC